MIGDDIDIISDTGWLIESGFVLHNENENGGINWPYFLSPASSKVGPIVHVCYEPLHGCDGWTITEPSEGYGGMFDQVKIPEMEKRDDVRKLCDALGIILK